MVRDTEKDMVRDTGKDMVKDTFKKDMCKILGGTL